MPRSPFRRSLTGLVVAFALAFSATPALASEPAGPADPLEPPGPVVIVATERPGVVGTARFRQKVRADPGTWQPEDVSLRYQWYLDDDPVEGATRRGYRPVRSDIGGQLAVEVTASREGSTSVSALSEPVRVRKGILANVGQPTLRGKRRFGHTLTARPGEWSRRPDRVRYQWLRAGTRVRGATGRRHHLGLADFDERMKVRVTVRKAGYRKAVATSRRTVRVMHRVPARHTVTYSVQTRGAISTSVDVFRQQAQATFDDPRGWRASGVAFRRVATGGAFRLVLSEASQVPSFSSGCSSEWSCRVGNSVVINQTRWKHASPMWNQRGRSLRDYRHMVVNHETGHWLGHGHRYCSGGGALAPVMMQQSKGLSGCVPNPWPTASERRTPRFG